ncbi:MAG: gluconokinase [Pirellulales bacterium]|nr:gluconokinase [Pirellulales bacterium]
MIIVLMGVSGCGKTTVGVDLAAHLGWEYQEGDALHPQKNILKMADGMPLNDEDRKPWIARVTDWINSHCLAGRDGVISCSALKKSYRQTITSKQNDVYLVYLCGTRELLSRRLAQRRDHFMPPDLLDSQLELLEEPSADERAIVVTIDRTPNDMVKSICDCLGLQ